VEDQMNLYNTKHSLFTCRIKSHCSFHFHVSELFLVHAWMAQTKTFLFCRNLILHMVQLGTALWALVLAPMSLILLVVSCIFPLTKFISFYSRQQLNHWTIH